MKLLYIANIRLPTERAHGIQIMKMCESFSNQGLEVELVIPRRINNISDDPFEYYSVKNNFSITRIPTIDLSPSRLGFWIQTIIFSFFAGLYVLINPAKIIYSRDDFLLYFLSYLIPRDIFWEVHTNRYNHLINRVATHSRNIIAVSNGLKNFLIEKGIEAKKIIVAHDGVDPDNFIISEQAKINFRKQLNIPINRKIFAYIGKYKTMSKDKGIDSLIRIFPEIKKKYPLSFLLIVGINQNELQNIKNIFDELLIDENDYKIVLHLPHSKIKPYLILSDIMVMNYPNIEHYALYMSPLKMFEYMASGNIIIASNLPSINEVLNENNSVLCEPDSPQSFIKAVEFVNDYPEEIIRRSRVALNDIKKYSWNNRAEIIKRLMS